MTDVLIRDVDEDALKRLKARARLHNRSLQKELKAILEDAGGYSRSEALRVADYWQAYHGEKAFENSALMIREDRKR